MPVLGQGYIPSGSVGTELTYVTRRAFIPKMIVQIYNSSPTIAALISNSQEATGGVSSVSVPVQGQAFVNTAWSDYSGTFAAPTSQQGAFLAEHDLKLLITPIPFLGMEGLVQLDHTIIPLIEARMNDSTNSAIDTMSTAIYNNFSTTNQQFVGLPGAVDDGTNLVTYGNINRTTNTWWKAKVYSASSASPTRSLVMQYITGVVKACGEKPTFGVMGMGTWMSLANDFLAVENYRVTPGTGFDKEPDGVHGGFEALSVGGVPIYADPYCPEGTMYLLNTDYLNLYMHKSASFSFTGFESLLSQYQLGYVGAVVTVAEMVQTKPISSARVGSFLFTTI